MARGLKFRIQEVEGFYNTICVVKTKALICIFVAAYTKNRLSYDAAHFVRNVYKESLIYITAHDERYTV